MPPPKPTFFPETTHFTQQVVETVVNYLPNNKASGKDGTYETFKNMQSHKILTTVFNVCLEYKRIPDSWKGALILRIPKKYNIPVDPSTWRDISLNQWLNWMCQCAPPGVISPIPVQGYADDVLMVSREECVVKNMLDRTDAFLEWSGLEIKHTKCAVLYERRSGGNRWYRSKSDKGPVFTVATKPIQIYSLHETYAYLGHTINIAGEWKEQVNIILSEFTSKMNLIDKSPLPLTMKLEAISQVVLSKVQHLFSNVHIQQKVLSEMDNKTVSLVRKWFGLNFSSPVGRRVGGTKRDMDLYQHADFPSSEHAE